MISTKDALYVLLIVALALFIISIILLLYSGVSLDIAIINAILYSLGIEFTTLSISKADNPFVPAVEIIDTLVFAILTVVLAGVFWDFISRSNIKTRLIANRISRLKNHIIIVPAEPFSFPIIEYILNNKKDITIVAIARNKADAEILKRYNLYVIEGNISDIKTYNIANIRNASYLIALSDLDSENVIISLTAKKLNPKLKIISRAHSQNGVDALASIGIDKIITAELDTAIYMGNDIIKNV